MSVPGRSQALIPEPFKGEGTPVSVRAPQATAIPGDSPPDNPTRAHVAAAVASGRRDVPLGANPALQSLAAVLVEGTPGALKIRFTMPPSSAQGNGVVGGGSLASALDMAMAMAVLSMLPPGRSCATISLSVNMLAPARVGVVFAHASVERVGRSVAFARAALHDVGGRQLASGTSSLAVLEERSV